MDMIPGDTAAKAKTAARLKERTHFFSVLLDATPLSA
jgi:hypothetical protein